MYLENEYKYLLSRENGKIAKRAVAFLGFRNYAVNLS
jgi:hypothetical protein